MAAEITTYDIQKFKVAHTSLTGNIEQPPTVEERLRQIDGRARSLIALGFLPPEEEETYRETSRNELRQEINQEILQRPRRALLGLPEDPVMAFVEKNERSQVHGKRMPTLSATIFERDDKEYRSEEERQSWQSRINLVQEAVETRLLFSLSIVPLDPNEKQTWYAKKQVSYNTLTTTDWEEAFYFTETIERPSQNENAPAPASSSSSGSLFDPVVAEPETVVLFHNSASSWEEQQEALRPLMDYLENLLGPLTPEFESEPSNHSDDDMFPKSHSSSRSSKQWSKERESPHESSPVLKGFFAPFPDFSSKIVTPHYDPEHLHPTVLVADVDVPGQVEQIVQNLEQDEIKTRINRLITSFREDAHAKGMGLMILEPSRMQIKTLYLKKDPANI